MADRETGTETFVNDWIEEIVDSPSKNKRSLHYDSRAKRHTTTKTRRGRNRGGRGLVAKLRGARG